jgi:hypothetical protein
LEAIPEFSSDLGEYDEGKASNRTVLIEWAKKAVALVLCYYSIEQML